MAIRWYVWPIDSVNDNGVVRRGPKYLRWFMNPTGIDVPWALMDYGLMPTGLLWADATAAQHQQAAGLPDVIAIPTDIDQQIGAGLAAVQAALETLYIPSDWVQTTTTYREVMKKAAQLFQFAQRYHGRTARKLIDAGYNLDTQMKNLPTNIRQSLNDTAVTLGYDTSAIKNNWTVRQALGNLAAQWGDKPIYVGGLTL